MISTKTINDIPEENIIHLLTFWNRKRRHGQTGKRGRRQSEKCGGGDIAKITDTFSEQAEGIGIGAVGDDIAKLVLPDIQNVGTELVKVREPAASIGGCIMILTAALHFQEA